MVGILRFLPRCQTPSSCSSTWTSALSPSWSTIGQSANWLSIFNTTIWLSLMQLNSNRFELSPHCVLWGSLITLRHPIGHIRHTPHDQKYNTPLYQVPWRCILWSSRENSLPHCLLSLGPLWGEKQFSSAVQYEEQVTMRHLGSTTGDPPTLSACCRRTIRWMCCWTLNVIIKTRDVFWWNEGLLFP